MSDVRLPQHGRDHRVGGSDPIPGLGDSGGGGIQFDTYPQEGNWLYVQTNDGTASPDGYGIELDDFSSSGVFLGSLGGGDLVLSAIGGGKVEIASTGGILIHEENTGGTSDVTIQSSFRDVFVLAHRNVVLHGGSAAPLELRSDGTYHIKTGATWVADL